MASGEQEEKPQVDSIDGKGTLPQNSETPDEGTITQDQDVSQASDVPVVTEDGALNSPQIETGLGTVVDSAIHSTVGNSQTPTNTGQSSLGYPDDTSQSSPTVRRPSFNLAAELQGADLNSSDEDTQVEGDLQSTTPSAPNIGDSSEETSGAQKSDIAVAPQEPLGADPGQQAPSKDIGAAPKSNDARLGRTEKEFQEESRTRLAAEERVKTLEAKLAAQQQRHDDEVEAAERRFERAIARANQAREADKEKFDMKYDDNDKRIQGFQAEIQKHVENVARLTAELEACEKSAAGDDAREGASARNKKLETKREELWAAIQREVNPSAVPPPTPKGHPRPGSARFLLAESEYLLEKNSRLYDALRAAANYADGREDWPSDDDKQLFEAFRVTVGEVNDFLEENEDRAQDCLKEWRRDWGIAAKANRW
ncbi:hypothetical protein UCDDA912_g04839 [Diaporthe ampelina]|uniref:Uncharacterized protein n=1 Tax=Diaporthe ampelina TaxID=1214573 RepID=A0A0G2HJH2_9PEZI|nr:hypothetical protein UCDDA912_g04839 [Diaporthe ampelina]